MNKKDLDFVERFNVRLEEPLLRMTNHSVLQGERRGTSVRLNIMLHKGLKILAAYEGRSDGDLINEAIKDLLVKYGQLTIREDNPGQDAPK